MNRRRFVGAAIAVAGLAACSRGRGRGAPAAAGPARRVVSISPSTTEALFAVGAGPGVIGRSRFCDWPVEATRLPAVGGMVDVDLEAILQLEPDLVVGSPGPASSRVAEKLAAVNIASWFPAMDSLAAIDAMLLGMGERTGHAPEARAAVSAMGEHLAAVERALVGEAAPRVLVVLEAGPIVAVGPHDFLDELVRRAHATNVLGVGGPWQALGFEQVVDLDPDVIVDASAMGGAGLARIGPDARGWRDTRAVREGRVVPMNDVRIVRPGPRVAEGLAVLARALHPHASVPSW